MTVKTAGIRHIHLLVADLDRSIRFYGDAFGMKEKFRDGDDLVFLNTPGTHDSLALHLVRGPDPPTSGERGVAVIHRLGTGSSPPTEPVDLAHRLVVTRIEGDRPFTLGCLRPVTRRVSSKDPAQAGDPCQLTSLLRQLPSDDDVVLLGDFSIVSRSHVPRYPVLRAWEYDALDSISASGLLDAFALLNPGVQVHSWVGRKGAGYRYDYGFVSEGLAEKLATCEYLHDFRLAGLSDHAGVVVGMHQSAVPSRGPAEPRELVRP